MLLLYFGPETYIPLASALAAGIGGLLAFWRRIVGFFRRLVTRYSDWRRAQRAGSTGPSPTSRDESGTGTET